MPIGPIRIVSQDSTQQNLCSIFATSRNQGQQERLSVERKEADEDEDDILSVQMVQTSKLRNEEIRHGHILFWRTVLAGVVGDTVLARDEDHTGWDSFTCEHLDDWSAHDLLRRGEAPKAELTESCPAPEVITSTPPAPNRSEALPLTQSIQTGSNLTASLGASKVQMTSHPFPTMPAGSMPLIC